MSQGDINPVSPLHTQAQSVSVGPTEVSWAWYVEGIARKRVDFAEALWEAGRGKGFVWIGLRDPTEESMRQLSRELDLHELAVEDAVHGHQRSKLEQFGDVTFMVISTVDYVEHEALTETSEIVSTGQIMIFLGPHFVVTSRQGGRHQMRALRAKLEADPEDLSEGPWRVLYGVLDHVIDDYTDTVQEMEADVEEIEAAVFGVEGEHEVERPYQLKRELIEFKRCVLPLGGPLTQLQSRPLPAIPEEARAYFRELSDHHLAAREAITSIDEVLTAILQAALARASVADNKDMRKISALVAILAVPTTLAAIYGMNFDNMPELRWEYGYFVLIGAMVTIMVALYLLFRKNRWL